MGDGGYVNYNGISYTVQRAVISGATMGDNQLVAAVTGYKIAVLEMEVVAAGAVGFRLESGAGGTALTGVMSLAANGGFVRQFSPVPWVVTAASALLNMELGGAVQVSGSLSYILIP